MEKRFFYSFWYREQDGENDGWSLEWWHRAAAEFSTFLPQSFTQRFQDLTQLKIFGRKKTKGSKEVLPHHAARHWKHSYWDWDIRTNSKLALIFICVKWSPALILLYISWSFRNKCYVSKAWEHNSYPKQVPHWYWSEINISLKLRSRCFIFQWKVVAASGLTLIHGWHHLIRKKK